MLGCAICFFLDCQLLNKFNAVITAHQPWPTDTFQSFNVSSIFFKFV